MSLTVGSLFSGIGGLDLGLERAGMTVRWQSEIDPYASRVLAKHWPEVPNLGDVTQIEWEHVEPVDLICGGVPCQPFSSAGAKRGTADPRWLWPATRDALSVLRPEFVIVENVAGLVADGTGFGTILGDLSDLGFHAAWDLLPAAVFGRPHRRYRLFLVAHSDRSGCCGLEEPHCVPLEAFSQGVDRDDAHGLVLAQRRAKAAAPTLLRMVAGLPKGVDDTARLRCLGNAVVPQVAEWIGRQLLDSLLEAE